LAWQRRQFLLAKTLNPRRSAGFHSAGHPNDLHGPRISRMGRLVGCQSARDEVVPDESTILRFRHLLEQHGLTHGIFDAVADLLEERRLLLRFVSRVPSL